MEQLQNSLIKFESDKEFSFKTLSAIIKKRWYFFFISLLIAFFSVFIYLRYSVPIYSVSARVFIKDKKSTPIAGQFLDDIDMFQPYSNIENEMILLKSSSIIKKTLQELNFSYSVFYHGRVKDDEVYEEHFFNIVPDTLTPQLINSKVIIIPKDENSFQLTIINPNPKWYNKTTREISTSNKSLDISKLFRYGETIKIDSSKFIILKDSLQPVVIGGEYSFIYYDEYTLLRIWTDAISVKPVNKDASIIELTCSGTNREKNVDFINMLCRVYIQDGLNEKNQIADNTLNFIDLQLNVIKDSLNLVEGELVAFRTKNKVMNIAYESEIDYSKLKELETNRSRLQINQKYYQYIKEYVSSAGKDYSALVVPSTMDINDPTLNKLIIDLITLVNEKQAMMKNNPSDKNPFVQNINSKIKITRDALIENLNNLNKASEITLNELNKNIASIQLGLSKLPVTEREFLNISRKFNVNDGIYNYLLQKRAEAAIAKATSTPDNKIVDFANIYNSSKIFPKNKAYYIFAGILGFLFPLSILLIIYFMDDKLYSKEDIQKRTTVPFIGSIVHSNISNNKIVLDKPKSGITESFRSIKANLDFFINENNKGVVLGITSSISGEGKTYVSLNLASVYAIAGKKVVLVSMDLRKPRIDKELFEQTNSGLSNYLAGMVEMDKIIYPSGYHDNLSFIPSGAIPPNPSELLNGEKIKKLLVKLKNEFDIVILDNSPVGLVVDYLNVIKEVDITLFIVRQGKTTSYALNIFNEISDKENLPKTGIILNDVKLEHNGYGQYGMGYYYGNYGHGYYEEDVKPRLNWLSLFKSKKNNS